MANNEIIQTAGARKCLVDLAGIVEAIFKDKIQRLRIGPAWPLFLAICLQANRQGTYTTTYRELSNFLQAGISTLKYWRRILINNRVLSSYSGGNCVRFCLEPPFIDFLIEDHSIDKNQAEKMTFQRAIRSLPLVLQRQIIEWIAENPNLLTTHEGDPHSYEKGNR